MRTLIILLLLVMCVNLDARTEPREETRKIKGSAAAYSTFDSTALSMMLWGTGLVIVITTAAILIPNSTANDNGNSHS